MSRQTAPPPTTDGSPAAPAPGPGRRRVYAVGLADSTGLGMYLAFSAVYLHNAVHLPNRQIGVALGVAGLASLLGALPVARFAQRYGLRRSLVVLFLIRAASFAALAAAVDLPTAALAAGVGGLLNRGIGPLIQSVLVAGRDSAGAVDGLARLRALRNIGMAAGALPSGAAVAVGTPWAYRAVMLAAAAVFVVCAAVARGFTGGGEVRQPAGRRGAGVSRNRPFLAVTALFGALTLSAILLGIGLPLWITQNTRAPSWSVGLVQILNTVLVVLLQVRVSRGSEKPRRARRMLLAGGLLAALAAALAPLSGLGGGLSALGVVAAVVLLFTLAELCISAGGTGLALAYTPEGQRPVYLATFNLGFASATVVGPSLVSAGLSLGRPGWFAWAILFVVLGLAALAIPAEHQLQRGTTDETT
ncbi:MFS transporter [Kitasatospora sp. GP82]|uniref:MFS transporter n=1 Tax=Kitasatospora sp. GP82 TaxID=3035089 RepID=UPI002475FE9D|nr:MFS transporter [Kitasatospora sp. GP82]MDH6129706.1 putative MFS family arabinose efflux permease [Kitasatospora sp. GP82]